MATISSPGIGSGLDVKSIVSQLVELEKQPLTKLQVQAATVQTRISAYGQIKSLVSTLSDAASRLNSLTTWNAVGASSSKPDAVQVSAIGGTAANSFGVQVNNLAKAQSYASASLAKNMAVGAGTLSIQLGQYVFDPDDPDAAPVFEAAGGGSPVSVTIGAADTLSDIASKINGANAGVSATVLNDGEGERLLLRSKATGEEAGFQLNVSDDDGDNADDQGLSRLVNGGTISQYGENARLTVNGSISVTSATNTFANVVSGVTLTVSATTDSPVEISVAQDQSVIRKAVDDFVAAYNAVNQLLNEATKYDAATRTPGLLQGDSTAIGIQSSLRGILQSTTTGSAFSRLADIGVTQQLGGNLSVDGTKLSAALKDNFEDVKSLFRTDSGSTTTNGVALKLRDFAQGLLAADGLFSTKDKSFKRSLDLNGKEQDRVNAKVARVEAQLNRRYSALDSQLAGLTALNNYVAQQVTLWNNIKYNN